MVIPCPECQNEVFVNDHSPPGPLECPSCETTLDLRYDRARDERYLVTAEEAE